MNKVEHHSSSICMCVSTCGCSKTFPFKVFFSSLCLLLRQFHLTTEVLFLGGKNNLIYEFFLPFRNLHRVVIGTNTVHFLCATRCFKVVSSSRSLSSPFIAQMFDIPWSLHSQVYFQLPEPIAFFNACFAAISPENFYFHHPNIHSNDLCK